MRYFEDIELGEVWKLGERPVDENEIMAFAAHYDPMPCHCEAVAAKESYFGSLTASSWHVNAMAMGLLTNSFKAQGLVSLGSPGINRCRWFVPVRPGDVLSGRSTVMAMRASNSRPMGIVTLRTEILNQVRSKVAQMDGVGMYGRRPVKAVNDVS